MWIDSHCHLNHIAAKSDELISDLVARAHQAGVSGMLNINCRISDEFAEIYEATRPFDSVWCTIGTHPHEAGDPAEQSIGFEKICDLAHDPKVVGIGESGLDYYYNQSPKEDQEESFRKHIRVCLALDLPLIVHARDADEDVIKIMHEEAGGPGNPKGLRGLMHCFSSGPQLARDALDFGFYISLSGIVTFKKADELRAIAKTVPLDRILVETDAPYLAPVPLRGKVNEPSYLTHTGEFLADLLGQDPADFAAQTTQNFYDLFTKIK